ncbi:MAG: hypothetical protein ABIK85_03890 [Candidatus Eisenbacteria bacterium]
MKRLTMLSAGVACAILLVPASPCSAAREQTTPEAPVAVEPSESPCDKRADELFGVRGELNSSDARGFRSVGEETLWIFDADFEDLTGDNAGWTSLDMSGRLGQINYWHKDTIRINGFEYLGDSTWWCGTYNDCWRQPRGYGNDWVCYLSRELPLSSWSTPGDQVVFEWDQRYAMEHNYDYGYVDVLAPGDSTWTTLYALTNPGFEGTPGRSGDWNCVTPYASGHESVSLSDYAGQTIQLRFRVESDVAYSSQDSYDNPPLSPCLDGAWQLDNFTLSVNDTVRWFDDCESPGDNGWVHESIPASGGTGVVFERVFEPDILHDDFSCWWRPSGWWMAAIDAETGRMVNGQNSWLLSPPIDISGADGLVAKWDAWFDCRRESNDLRQLWLSVDESAECLYDNPLFVEATSASWGGPGIYRETDDWDGWAWGDWLGINWRLWNDEPPEPGAEHMTGFMLDRQRVGVPVGGPPTIWIWSMWDRFHDTFDIAEALSDTTPALIKISDGDGIVSAFLVVSSDGGSMWESLPLIDVSPDDDWWLVPLPVNHIAPSTEIWYYFEATDGAGNVRTHPKNAPDTYYEFSILPILGSVSEPAILLVDKHGRVIRNEDGEFRQTSERYFREALDVLGFEYDVYDVEVPSGSTDQSNGPDSAGQKYYDTQVWFTDDFNAYTIKRFDQVNLINWLSEAQEGKERNLLLTGNEIGEELVGYETDTLDFYSGWLASEYLVGDVASTSDTSLILHDAGGGFDFMTHDDRACPLRLLEWDYG